jgi:hypothetical protein
MRIPEMPLLIKLFPLADSGSAMNKGLPVILTAMLAAKTSAQLYYLTSGTVVWDTISPSSMGWCRAKIDRCSTAAGGVLSPGIDRRTASVRVEADQKMITAEAQRRRNIGYTKLLMRFFLCAFASWR